MDLINIVLTRLQDSGFNDMKPLEDLTVKSIISVTDLRGESHYKIVLLDATATKEFADLVYVAVENNTNSLLEIAKKSSSPKIIDDSEATQLITSFFPTTSFNILSGYFWKPCVELTSRLSIARKFTINSNEMFLLPNGQVIRHLTEFSKGGG